MSSLDIYQQDAVASLNKNIVVSASAGAGKTHVLIERLMKRILVDGVQVNEICALTFTEKAANEMKVRLLSSLNNALTQENSSEEELNFIEQQIVLVETANISTIHAFCLEIIKKYGYIIDLDPARANNILDPGVVALYQDKALKETLDIWFKQYPTECNLLLETFVSNPANLEPLKTAIRTTADHLNSRINIDDEIERINQLYQINDFDELPTEIKITFFSYYNNQLSILYELIDEFMNIAYDATLGTKHDSFPEILGNEVLPQLKDLILQAQNHNFDFYDRVLDVLNFTIPTVTKQPEYKQQGDIVTDAIKKLLKGYTPHDEFVDLLNEQATIVSYLLNISRDYLFHFEQEKERVGGFDFNDFEHYALKILQYNEGYIAKQLQSQYKEIMVDEFQDTNHVQDSIIRLISPGDNIFRVGDVKQSIYRFRGAKPSIMQNLMVPSLNDVHVIHFMHNYRSKEAIVSFNNDLFSQIMNQVKADTYTDQDHVTVGIDSQRNRGFVNLKMYYQDLTKENVKPLNANDKNMYIAKCIANEIIELHTNQQIEFRDITILTRRHADKKFLKKAFDEANIPSFIDDRSGFFRSNVIDAILAWLEYSVTYEEYFLVPILTSPFIGYTESQVGQLKISNDSIRDGLKRQDPETFNFIHDTIKTWGHRDIVDILTELINMNNVYHQHLSLQVKTNVDLLLERAIAYQNSNNPNIIGFLNYVRKLDDDQNSESIPFDENANVVTVSTIHQSKGLQYPVTILWPMGKRQILDFKDPVLTDDVFGVLVNDYNPLFNQRRKNILRYLAEAKQNNEDLEEYIRLLYVATTRAKDQLIIIDVVNELPQQELSKYLMHSFSRSTDFIYMVESPFLKIDETCLDYVEFKSLTKSLKKETTMAFPLYSKLVMEDSVIQKREFSFNPKFHEATEYGSTLHNAIEQLPHRIWNNEDLKIVDSKFHLALRNYNTNPLTQLIYTYQHIEHEMPILYKEKDIVKQGYIDLYAYDEKSLILVDFKSDNVDEESLIERYTDQIERYKKALNDYYPGLNYQAYIYSFKHHKYLSI